MLTALFSTIAAWTVEDPFRAPLREW